MVVWLQYGEDVDVHDWFASFCEVHSVEVAQEQPDQPSPPKKARKAQTKRGSRKVLQASLSPRAIVVLL